MATSIYWNPDGWWILGIGIATNVACAVLGCFLVLRRMAMMGDALSHAVLPGLAVAFIASGSFNILPLFVGAIAAGLLMTFLSQTLHQYALVPSDASMGVTFTTLFAVGVILIKKYIEGVHFDIDCVYEGNLLLTPYNTVEVFGTQIPYAALTIAPVLIVNLSLLALLWKEFQLTSFDPALATTMGISATAMHYLLMAMVSVTAVASFEAVGSILVVAMLIVPGATAHLLTDRLAPMVMLSAVIAAAAALGGYVLAIQFNVNLAGMMAVTAGVLFSLVVLFSPQYGVLSALIRNFQMTTRVLREDLLSMLYRIEELGGAKRLTPHDACQAVGGGWQARWGLNGLISDGRIDKSGDELLLTPAGRETARQLVRTHRLWETYLVEHLGLALDHVHEPAHRIEHYVDEDLREKLEQELDSTGRDPHGREIPD